ncbi:MAG: hypothetical protein JRJ59_11420 [Deltaproteobacteria bacterium]|nr:hypothetical protein [Deltaproteobacteria bacterium]
MDGNDFAAQFITTLDWNDLPDRERIEESIRLVDRFDRLPDLGQLVRLLA